MLEFQELKVLVAIIEAGSFQRAGQMLYLTQPAVSQSLANLERKVGEKLVERTSPVRPTVVGKELLSHARFILEREKEFVHDLTKIKNGYLQKLTLAVDYLVNEYFAHEVIRETTKRFSQISFRVKRLPAREMIRAVQEKLFELGFGAFQKNMEGLKSHKLFEETSYLVTSSHNPELIRYRGDPMGFLGQTTLLASYLDEPALRPSKIKIRDYFRAAWEVDNIGLQVKLLNEGLAVTYLPEKILERDPIAKKFVVLEKIPFYKVTKPYGIYYHENEKLSQGADAFIEEARKITN